MGPGRRAPVRSRVVGGVLIGRRDGVTTSVRGDRRVEMQDLSVIHAADQLDAAAHRTAEPPVAVEGLRFPRGRPASVPTTPRCQHPSAVAVDHLPAKLSLGLIVRPPPEREQHRDLLLGDDQRRTPDPAAIAERGLGPMPATSNSPNRQVSDVSSGSSTGLAPVLEGRRTPDEHPRRTTDRKGRASRTGVRWRLRRAPATNVMGHPSEHRHAVLGWSGAVPGVSDVRALGAVGVEALPAHCVVRERATWSVSGRCRSVRKRSRVGGPGWRAGHRGVRRRRRTRRRRR